MGMIARLICAACLLLMAACSTPSLFGSDSTRGPVDDMLDRRSQAFRAGNEANYLADLDRGNTAMIQHERMVYANLRQFRFSDFRYHQYLRPELRKPVNLEDGHAVTVTVQLALHLDGIDSGDTQDGFDYTIVPRNGKPMITKIEANGLMSGNHGNPWDDVPLHTARSGNVTVAADGTVGDLGAVASSLSAAEGQVRQVWGRRPAPPGFLVFVTTDQQRARGWLPTASLGGVESSAFEVPVAGTDRHDDRSGENVGGRVVLTVGRIPADQLGAVYRHELTHAISAPLIHSIDRPPTWAIEGIAAWMEGDAGGRVRLAFVRSAVKRGRFTGQLPDTTLFYTDPDLNYALGYSVFKFVADRWGPERAVELYAQAVSGHTLGQATTSALSLDGPTFLAQWQGYVRQLAR
jgi:hypothetical protein